MDRSWHGFDSSCFVEVSDLPILALSIESSRLDKYLDERSLLPEPTAAIA